MIGSLLRIRYEVLQELESTSIFQAYRVKDRVSGREMKVRMFKPPFDQEAPFLSRVREVISEATAVSHPNLERMMDLDDHEGTPFLVSELSPGQQLSEKVRKLAPFSAPVALGIAIGICEALVPIHELGHAHGDVSASNAFVTQDSKVKVALPGFWRAYSASQTAGMTVLPSMAPYLAPEVTEGSMPNPTSDVYSLGVILFELLTGKYPFSADTAVAMAMKHASAPIPGVRVANPGIPQALEDIVRRAMSKTPSDRFADASALLSELRILQDSLRFGRPVAAAKVTQGTAATPTSVPTPPAQMVAPKMGAIRPDRADKKPQSDEEDSELSDAVPRWIQALGYIAVLTLVVLLGGYVAWNITSPKMVKVPNIVGRNIAEATKDLERIKLNVTTQAKESDRPEGVVIAMSPEADGKVKEGASVLAIVSSGGRFVEVPDLRGKGQDEAKELLGKLGLEVELKKQASRDFAPGVVFRQNPRAKQKIEKESSITLYVSTGRGEAPESGTGPLVQYRLKFGPIVTDAPIVVRVDMIDDENPGALTVYERELYGGDIFNETFEGRGDRVLFKIYYDGQLVAQANGKPDLPRDKPEDAELNP